MSTNDERRRFTRISFASNALVKQGDQSFDVHLLDISLNGVLIETPAEYAVNADEPADVQLTLAGDIAISMTTRLVHSSNNVLGFHCESIDMESMTHLRRLIELNLQDPKASERVLKELLCLD